MSPLTTKKYAVFSGYIFGDTIDHRQLVTAERVMKLYGLSRKECILVPYSNDEDDNRRELRGYDTSKLTFLYPDPTGQYKLDT